MRTRRIRKLDACCEFILFRKEFDKAESITDVDYKVCYNVINVTIYEMSIVFPRLTLFLLWVIIHLGIGHIEAFQHLRSLPFSTFTALGQPLDLPRQHICNTKIKRCRPKLDFLPHDLCPFVPSGVDPPYEVEMVDLGEGAEVCALKCLTIERK